MNSNSGDVSNSRTDATPGSPDTNVTAPVGRVDQMRRNYTLGGLLEKDVASDPLVQFHHWFNEAAGHRATFDTDAQAGDADEGSPSGIPEWFEPNAMTLSTSTPEGHVSSRIVLLKGVEEEQFVFFTNYDSVKSQQIDVNPMVSLCFFWPHLQRQVMISGRAERIARERSERYFHSRPRASQLGAHASTQSSVIESREVLEARFEKLAEQFPDETTIPLPDNWGGFAVTPTEMEFWQGRTSRLHDRIVYRRDLDQPPGTPWKIERLSP
ncbi:pyridoxamine 5'-phosphate oxidase [Rhodopirellula sallentina]|uniref:Pyridoxine/pyridoxamine 5'-phosphate oxidase n=1 Tax=Rhodopirellula sallentina SM41 TaxID=1263870 RepID=M5U5T5_9BACT|nr:pyridoxamine 5'-phosphate oxidase [Rhodopirellula sallentina]EMI53201.1 Pyridoxamine 5'-phosphate oxidase [Rhodopirellula sallentina SM41]